MQDAAAIWDSYYRQNRYVMWWPKEGIVRFVVNERVRAGSDRKVLDFGCGNGRHLWLLTKEGFNATGIDISREAISMAKKWMKQEELSFEALHIDNEHIPVSDNIFDLCFAISVFEFMPMKKTLSMIKKLHSILAPGGRICITVRSSRDRNFRAGKKIEKNTFLIPDAEVAIPIHFFDWDELQEIMAPFREIKIESNDIYLDNHSYILSEWLVTGTK